MDFKNSFCLCLFLCTLIACGSKKNNSPVAVANPLQTIFVHGDPLNLIEGSTLDKKSFISKDHLRDFDNYSFSSIQQYTEKFPIVQESDTRASVEDGNEAPEEEQSASKEFFSFKKEDNGYTYSSDKLGLRFGLIEENGLLQLKTIEVGNGTYDLKVLHYSQKKSKDAFSILAELQDKAEGRILYNFVFIKESEQKAIAKTDKKFKYSMGPGVIFSWPKNETIQADACGNLPSSVSSALNRGFSQWKRSLQDRAALKSEAQKIYPPFSDLNSHCTYMVDNYFTEQDKRYANPATTVSSKDGFKGTIIDADIFVWKKEVERSNVDSAGGIKPFLEWVMVHELGHFLGLSHQFDDHYKSVMSYDLISELTPYDHEAIQVLYPLLKPTENK